MKVLIVDDEPNVRSGIKMLIPWQDYGFEIGGEAVDGPGGLEKIMTLNPELVLMDIRMPGLSGLEVVEQARKQGYKGHFIITTGYSDFEYAKKAIHLGVSTYILKPIDEDELMEAVEKIRCQIKEERILQDKIEASNLYIKKSMMTNLLMGNRLSSEEKAYYDSRELKGFQYCIVVVQIKKQEKNQEEIMEMISGYFENKGSEFSAIISWKQMVLILQYTPNTEKRLLDLSSKVSERYQVELRMAMSQGFEQLKECGKAYKQAEKLLEQYFLFPKAKLLRQPQSVEKVVKIDKGRDQDGEGLGNKLYHLLQVGDRKKIKEALEDFKTNLQRERFSKQRIISISTQILLNAVQQIADTYSELTQIISNGETMIEQIYKCRDIDEIISYMEVELFKILDAFCVNTPEHTMQKIVYYINNNYGSELKLEYLAELFNYNSAYLGKSFRNYTGKSFNVYLEQLRISKAKELLLEGHMKVYEIGKVVGYKHMDYFYSKFRKYVGISPLEYKKAMEVAEISN